jgi:hypothetical protein
MITAPIPERVDRRRPATNAHRSRVVRTVACRIRAWAVFAVRTHDDSGGYESRVGR